METWPAPGEIQAGAAVGFDVRPAMPHDAAAIAAIYNEGIADRIATFETEPRTPAQIVAWFDAGYIVVVGELDGRVVAWASASPYRPNRPAYRGVGEYSVYVARSQRGRGVGRPVLAGLIRAAEARGFWKLVSRIFPENAASVRLAVSVGFRVVGTYRRHAKLDGEWRDCVIVERLIGEAALP